MPSRHFIEDAYTILNANDDEALYTIQQEELLFRLRAAIELYERDEYVNDHDDIDHIESIHLMLDK